MEEFQQIAYDMLTDTEKQVLYLTISQGQSSWASTQFMKGMTHYKFLEIKQRAQRLFKLFADFYAIYPQLFNPKNYFNPRFKDYIYGVMVKRLPLDEAIEYAGDAAWQVRPIRYELISKEMDRLKFSSDTWDQDTFKLIVEFDRWNNFRILPKKFQAESAFNRRSTKKCKTYIKYLFRIPDYKIRFLIDKFWYFVKKQDTDNVAYVALVSDMFDKQGGYQVMPIKNTESNILEISKFYMYIFPTIDDATEFGVLVSNYFETAVANGPAGGIKFWSRYKSLTRRTINYKYINNLDLNYSTMDAAFGLKKTTKKKNGMDRR